MRRLTFIALSVAALSFLANLASAAEFRRDVEYGRAGDTPLLLDASVPDGDGPFPIAILIHGGGWDAGDKSGSNVPGNGADISPWFAPLTAARFAWLSINYRLSPQHRWPACLEDVQTAIRWAKAHAREFKGDPRRITLFGHSAGGQLACYAALVAQDDTRVQAVVGFAPVTDLELDTQNRGGLSTSLQRLFNQPKEVSDLSRPILRDASPVNRITPAAPPFLLIHGDADKTVPFAMTEAFLAKLKSAGVRTELLTVKGGGHSLVAWEKIDVSYQPAMIAWLQQTLAAPPPRKPDAIVAADGSGNYTTVRATIDAAPQFTHAGTGSWTILVKPGTYRELIYIQREKRFISLVGEDAGKTILTFDLYNDYPAPDGKPLATFRTPTVMLDADDFTIENLTIANSAGPKGQALALRVDGDRAVFRRCRFLGWQDTILLNRGRHYFEDCTIVGATDFIFGGATAYFERCHLHAAGSGYLTAASTPDDAPYGFVFSHCKITGETPGVKTYLGRPWRDYAQTVFLFTEMSAHVRAEGWDNWKKPHAEKVSRYSEFGSTGPGADPAARVAWAKPLAESAARTLTPQKILGGSDGWDPLTGETRAHAPGPVR